MFPLRDSTHLNYLSQNVTFSHLLFGRVSSGRKRRHKQIARLRNKCAMTCFGKKKSSLLGDTSSSRCNIVSRARLRAEWLRASVRVKRVTHAREGNNFTDTVYSLFTTHHSLIHNDTVFLRFTSHFSLKNL